ncbi:MAG: SBBP repeat-containing protein [Chlorobi bacterium]|nr:SBBP repeat-containing protein [Chlorobiota bacterium]MCI0714975.1 SBBP repeat-containing protein [Chlorobiota bacterium]
MKNLNLKAGRIVETLVLLLVISLSLSSQPSQQWAARYNNGSTEQCNAMRIDASGNVYVTGSSRSGGLFTEDIATIKYNTSGSMLWTKRYVGAGAGEDHAYAMALDASGNVYVTGRTWVNTGNNNDIVTIKYNSAGDSLWVKKYNGSRSNHDEAFAIFVDAAGNVYVTGSSQGTVGPNGIFDDLIVIKYSSSGSELWSFRYNGPSGGLDKGNSIVCDVSGNVYVVGTSWGGSGSAGSGFDMVYLKLNSMGVSQWVNRYTSAGNADDELLDMKIDAGSYLYATGFEYSTGTNKNYWIMKYNSAGSIVWSRTYNGPDNDDDFGYSIAVDRSGNVVVAGKSDGGASSFDIATVKYNSAGVLQWTNRFNGVSNTIDEGKSVAVDSAGNVYVAGYSSNPTTANDYQTIKYNSAGIQLWEIKYTNSGASGSSDMANSIYADNLGNVYIAGTSALDYAVVKYAPATGLNNTSNAIPDGFSLMQNFPNPFNPTTNIEFMVPANERVSLKVYDVNGRLVADLVDESLNAGTYRVDFNASNLSSGVYFYKLITASFTATKKIMLVK